jgi:hypothetical protein
MTSYHPKDIEYRYCGNCHNFHDRILENEQVILKKAIALMDEDPSINTKEARGLAAQAVLGWA